MTRSWLPLAGLVCLVLCATGCVDVAPSGGAPTAMVVGTGTEISFSLPGIATSAVGGTAPDHVVFVELADDPSFWKLHHAEYSGGDFSIFADSGAVYALGFASGGGAPAGSSVGTSDLAGAISSIGGVQIVAAQLDTIPLASSADVVDLGELTTTGTGYGSGIPTESIASETGYATTALSDYGTFDLANRLLMNPDIDRDGAFDADTGIRWRFATLVDMPNLAASFIDIDSETAPIVDPAAFRTGALDQMSMRYVLWFADAPQLRSEIVDAGRVEITHTDPDTGQQTVIGADDRPNEGDWLQVYFRTPSELRFTSGDFRVSLDGTDRLFFDNVDFMSPDAGYEGFMFPITQVTSNGAGVWQTLRWEWVMVRDGAFVRADPEAVRLATLNMYWGFWEDGTSDAYYGPRALGSDVDFWVGGTIDISSRGFTNGPAGDVNFGYVRSDFWDRGDNNYSLGWEVQ